MSAVVEDVAEKVALLEAVSGLNRGLLATPEQRATVERAVAALEAVHRAKYDLERDGLEPISGKWKLLYTSSREVPSTPVSKVGAIYQRIQAGKRRIENIVEVELEVPGAALLRPRLPAGLDLPSQKLSLTIGASCAVVSPRRVALTIQDKTVRARGRGVRPLRLPSASPFSRDNAGDFFFAPLRPSGYFDVTYLDGDVRVSRGSRGEVRVFTRAGPEGPGDQDGPFP
eukprot:tig00020614_g12187.t1